MGIWDPFDFGFGIADFGFLKGIFSDLYQESKGRKYTALTVFTLERNFGPAGVKQGKML